MFQEESVTGLTSQFVSEYKVTFFVIEGSEDCATHDVTIQTTQLYQSTVDGWMENVQVDVDVRELSVPQFVTYSTERQDTKQTILVEVASHPVINVRGFHWAQELQFLSGEIENGHVKRYLAILHGNSQEFI
ncbi:hypothetical protein D3C87_1649950 [compost metagenome]